MSSSGIGATEGPASRHGEPPFTIEECGDFLRLSPLTVRRQLIDTKILPCQKVGHTYLISPKVVYDFVLSLGSKAAA